MSSLPNRVRRIAARTARDVVVNTVVASPAFPRGLRPAVLRALGWDVARSTINGSVFLGSRSVTVGRDAFVNYGAFLDGADAVHIGERVSIGPRVVVLTGTHEMGGRRRRAGDPVSGPVTIGDGAWIGAHVTILPGVTVGAGAVVAAGAVVTGDVPADTLVAGVPARPVRRLDDGAAETSR